MVAALLQVFTGERQAASGCEGVVNNKRGNKKRLLRRGRAAS